MAIATTITEDEVKQYMEDVLGDTSSKLGWTKVGGDFDEPTNEVLYTLDESGFVFVNTQAEVKKVRMTARMEVWRAAMFYTVHEISHSAGAPGTGQTSRADIHRHAKDMYELAKSDLMDSYPELSSSISQRVERTPIDYKYDYYGNAE